MFEALLIFVHVLSLAFWFCGLFAYLLIVWPAVERAQDGFPRSQLVSIGNRTAPWIYLTMFGVLGSFLLYQFFMQGNVAIRALYLIVLVLLVGNNAYGSMRAWPSIMLSPRKKAEASWAWFKRRMFASLVFGLGCLCVSLFWGITA